jgi:hypothetical protein
MCTYHYIMGKILKLNFLNFLTNITQGQQLSSYLYSGLQFNNTSLVNIFRVNNQTQKD